MMDLQTRRQERALRKLRNAGVPEAELPTGSEAVAEAEAADRRGDPYALGGIGRNDPTAVLVKG